MPRRRSKVPKFCAACGAPRDADERFCGSCGTEFAEVDAGEFGSGETQAAAPAPPGAPQPQAPPTQVVYTPPPPTATVQASSAPPAVPPGARSVQVAGVGMTLHVLPLLGAVAVVVSSWLDWTGKLTSYDVLFEYLFGGDALGSGFKLGVAVLIVGIACGALSLFPGAAPIRRLAGLAAMAAAVLFAIQIGQDVHDAGGGFGDFFDSIEAGVYVCLAGGFLVATQR